MVIASGEAVFLGFLLLPDARGRLAAYLLLFLGGSLLSLFAARSLSASKPRLVILCAAAFRATLLFRTPDLSTDVHRYAWDGRVAAQGFSPYAFAPADRPDLLPDLQSRLEHREFRTVYPPVAQAVFRAAAELPGSDVVALKAAFAAADVGVVALLAIALRSPSAAALYAFHPLPVTEVAGQGHLDALGVALLLAAVALVATPTRRPAAAGCAWAASVLVKLVPLASTLPFLRRGGLRFAAAAAVVGGTLWAAASQSGATPAAGLGAFGTRWDSNSLVYPAAVAAVDATALPDRAKAAYIRWKAPRQQRPWMQAVFPYFYPELFARLLLAVLLAGVLLVIAARVAELDRAVFASIAALLLLSPTLHPWYLLWALPFAALRREPAFFYLASVAPVAYGLLYPLAGWSPLAIRVVEYAPFAGLLAWSFWRVRRRA